jgi:hypothetical protein
MLKKPKAAKKDKNAPTMVPTVIIDAPAHGQLTIDPRDLKFF